MGEIGSVSDYLEAITQISNEGIKRIYEKNKSRPKFNDYLNDDYREALYQKTNQQLKMIKRNIDPVSNKRSSASGRPSKSPHYKMYFRGHNDIDLKLLPSVFRNKYWGNESYFYHEIVFRCPEHFYNLTPLERLVLMQHYNCPTRLLDVTSNPLVALYFACLDSSKSPGFVGTPGEVLIFQPLSGYVAYSDSDKVLMLSCLSKFSFAEQKQLFQCCMNEIFNRKFHQLTNSTYQDEIVERFYYEVGTHVPAFKREIEPFDLLNPIFIQPDRSNERIIKQSGAFILSGLSALPDEADAKLQTFHTATLRVTNKKGILHELEQLEINEASLFPEIDKVADYLKNSI